MESVALCKREYPLCSVIWCQRCQVTAWKLPHTGSDNTRKNVRVLSSATAESNAARSTAARDIYHPCPGRTQTTSDKSIWKILNQGMRCTDVTKQDFSASLLNSQKTAIVASAVVAVASFIKPKWQLGSKRKPVDPWRVSLCWETVATQARVVVAVCVHVWVCAWVCARTLVHWSLTPPQ